MAERRIEKSPFFLVIAGNIGVGKTTLANYISEKFGWDTYYERVIDNPYLEDFYGDMKRWSFNLQIYFLSRRFIDHQKIVDSKRSCVQDRSIYEDVEIFAYILHQQGNMSERDYHNYKDLFAIMTSYLRKPDLIIYLQASTWTLLTRIRKRGRDYEKRITKEYLHQLNEAYERWIRNASQDFNIITLDADHIDFEKNPQHLDEIYHIVSTHVKEIE